eukprot:TRINITY_DN2244_c0_g1_i3.p1 TRINITY_DN2244_c0_g1~~TRINITY_DN2244_c0_g1_i3.p1  ORF type:complete len:460 (+),score=86.43 TRINITY_DN2244_c0_g1_i3:27-1406(+)
MNLASRDQRTTVDATAQQIMAGWYGQSRRRLQIQLASLAVAMACFVASAAFMQVTIGSEASSLRGRAPPLGLPARAKLESRGPCTSASLAFGAVALGLVAIRSVHASIPGGYRASARSGHVVARRFQDEDNSFSPQSVDVDIVRRLLQRGAAGLKTDTAAAVREAFKGAPVGINIKVVCSLQASGVNEKPQPSQVGIGWGSATRTAKHASTPQASSSNGVKKLNAELANGRLAMLTAFMQHPRDSQLSARRAVDPTADTADAPVSAKKADEIDEVNLKELPDDECYGWGDDDEIRNAPGFDPRKQVGICAPMGYFDPLNLCEISNRKDFRWKRASELKHGRVAMLACIGLVGQHYVKMPWFDRAGYSFQSQFDEIFTVPGLYVFSVFILSFFFMELAFWAQDEQRQPGDFGDPLGFGMYDDEMRNRELNNGRFAMFCAVGIIAAQLNTGKDAVQQFGLP